jgi:hypothetical protein
MVGEGARDLAGALVRAGIAHPPFGSIPESAITTYRTWAWGSRDVPPIEMYMFDVDLIARTLRADGPFFALNHAGHGTNSYGLNLVTAAGPMAVCVQHPYGGFYSDPLANLIAINTTYSRLHVLFQAAKGQENLPLKWLLVYSPFRGEGGIVDLGRGVPMVDKPIVDEVALFKAAAERLDDRDFFKNHRVRW